MDMLSIFFLLLSILLTVLNPVGHKPVRVPSHTQDFPASKARVLKSYGALPMSFEVNQGQADRSRPVSGARPGLHYFIETERSGAGVAITGAGRSVPRKGARPAKAIHSRAENEN